MTTAMYAPSAVAATAVVYASPEDRALLDGIDAADLFITSGEVYARAVRTTNCVERK